MPRVPRRKMTLADLMILVAASGCGIAASRAILPIEPGRTWTFYVVWASPLLACWTVATLAVRLRVPRPPIRRLFRQPGAACGVVALAVLAIWTGFLSYNILTSDVQSYWDWYYAAIPVGSAVLGSWIITGLTRTSRPEASGIDRLGRLIGASWVVEMIVATYEIFA